MFLGGSITGGKEGDFIPSSVGGKVIYAVLVLLTILALVLSGLMIALAEDAKSTVAARDGNNAKVIIAGKEVKIAGDYYKRLFSPSGKLSPDWCVGCGHVTPPREPDGFKSGLAGQMAPSQLSYQQLDHTGSLANPNWANCTSQQVYKSGDLSSVDAMQSAALAKAQAAKEGAHGKKVHTKQSMRPKQGMQSGVSLDDASLSQLLHN
jgi:hypothetical protein